MGRRDNAMRRRAGAQSKQQRGVEGEPMQRRRDPASIETISYANLRMVHVPLISLHEMTRTGTFSTSSNCALSVLDLYGVVMGIRLIDRQGGCTHVSEVSNFEEAKSTCRSCSSLG